MLQPKSAAPNCCKADAKMVGRLFSPSSSSEMHSWRDISVDVMPSMKVLIQQASLHPVAFSFAWMLVDLAIKLLVRGWP